MPRWLVSTIKLLLTALVIVFVAWQLRGAFAAFSLAELRPDLWLSFLGLAVFCLYLLSQALIWWRLTAGHDIALPLGATLAIWCYSILGKYVPGKALLWAVRYAYYRARCPAFSGPALLRCFVLEFFCGVAAGFALALLATIVVPTPLATPGLRLAAGAMLLASLAAVHPAVLAWFEHWLSRALKVEAAPTRIGAGETLAAITAYAAGWIILGLAVFLLARAVEPSLRWSACPYVAAAYVVAGLVGFLALFAPSGIGVREGVLIAGLSQVMPLDGATVVAVLARLVSTVGEVLLAAGAAALGRGVPSLRAVRHSEPQPRTTLPSEPRP